MINPLTRKVDNWQEQIGSFNSEMEITHTKKNQMERIDSKQCMEMKKVFNELEDSAQLRKESVILKIG